MCVLHFGTSAKQQRGINKFKGLWRTYTRLYIFFLYLNVSAVVIVSLKLSFRVTLSLAFLKGSNAIFLAGKTTEINEPALYHFTKPLPIASMIAL